MDYDPVREQQSVDLNRLAVEVHECLDAYGRSDGREYRRLPGARADEGRVRVYFADLEARLLALIKEADAVLGCVAWLTSEPLLAALAEKKVVALVVQKEDFLRPDTDSPPDWRTRLRRLYGSLRCDLIRYEFQNVVAGLSVASSPDLEPIRCVGIYNGQRAAACPRMHHKFLVLADVDGADGDGFRRVNPHTVWTGSFNLTRNATLSLENAVVLTHREIVAAYYQEWGHVEALSEPLDWETEWVCPEWRIGS